MKMKKIFALALFCTAIFIAGGYILFAQTNAQDPTSLGIDTSQQAFQEVSISKFEDPGMWEVFTPSDFGYTFLRRLPGGPLDKEPIPQEAELDNESADDYVLGVRTHFLRRASNSIIISARRPIPIEGICKQLSVWVAGRNYSHTLNVFIRDYTGATQVLTAGRLNFAGWKQLVVTIPPEIPQRNPHYTTESAGISFLGFEIACDPADAIGTYYVYFDDLRAQTDLFTELSRDPDDILDNW